MNMPPSVEKLSQNYFNHKREFNELAKRVLEDQQKGLERIDNTWTRPNDLTKIGLTYEDISNYRKAFEKLSIPRGFYAFPEKVIFIAHTSGLSISGTSMGYTYSIKTPTNYFKENCGYSTEPLKHLDDYKGCSGYAKSYTIHQKIDDNWYIYEEFED